MTIENRLAKLEGQAHATRTGAVEAMGDDEIAKRLEWVCRWAGISRPPTPWNKTSRAAVVRFAKLTIAQPGGIRVGGLTPLALQERFRRDAESCGLALTAFKPAWASKPRPSSSSTETPQRPAWAGGDGSSYL
jgi:hypothetical protein